jgi:hypothetical protein
LTAPRTPAPPPPPLPLPAARLDSLAEDGLCLLAALAGRAWIGDFYLAGSAALALYAGHREVHGLDLMSAKNRLTSPDRRDLLADLLEVDPGFTVETARDGFLYARSGGGTALRLFHYPYPLVAPCEPAVGLEPELLVASPLDLGLMKVAAIISRGTRRDFVDLHLLCRHLPLSTLLAWSPQKFPHVRDFPLQALKGLADLDQTTGDPMPNLTLPLTWPEVTTWVRQQVHRLGREHVGLPSPSP